MAETIPDSHKDLFEGPVCVTLTTIMPDGFPQSSVIWCTYDAPYIWFSSISGRAKTRNIEANPKVAIMAIDPQDPYRYVEVRGIVEEITREGGVDLIEQLSMLYEGKPFYGGYADANRKGKEERLVFKVKPIRVRTD